MRLSLLGFVLRMTAMDSAEYLSVSVRSRGARHTTQGSASAQVGTRQRTSPCATRLRGLLTMRARCVWRVECGRSLRMTVKNRTIRWRRSMTDNTRERERRRNYQRQWASRNPEKIKAHTALNQAVLRGDIERPDKCEWCGRRGRIEGSHTDYFKPLEVDWLCRPCHIRKDGQAKLTEDQVREIRASTESQRVAAARYGVTQVAVCLIRQGKRWRNLP